MDQLPVYFSLLLDIGRQENYAIVLGIYHKLSAFKCIQQKTDGEDHAIMIVKTW